MIDLNYDSTIDLILDLIPDLTVGLKTDLTTDLTTDSFLVQQSFKIGHSEFLNLSQTRPLT